jgi:UDP-GlcNAc3NAcA epimerase
MKIVTIIGARPQFIKAAAVSRVIRGRWTGRIEEVIVHTGQHHDKNMSAVFFDELDIPRPHHDLGISGGNHGAMTGRMLESVENVLLAEKPDWVLVYGDTNSTLAGALAAVKLHLPVAHVEAGLRSYDMNMPEEINRVLVDRISTLLFCPTETAVGNLKAEGITRGVHLAGDVMYDVTLHYRDLARSCSDILSRLGLAERGFALATCHRAGNTDDPQRLANIMTALARIAARFPVVLPLHPRTRKQVEKFGLLGHLGEILVTEPLSFLDMVALEQAARVILTDSGGVQKEAFFHRVPCVTMRDETEWVETVRAGANLLAGTSVSAIVDAFDRAMSAPLVPEEVNPYGDGDAAGRIVATMMHWTCDHRR